MSGLAPTLRSAIWELLPHVALDRIDPLDAMVMRSTAPARYRAVLVAAFGACALVLAAVGMFGVTSRAVASRRRELGVRVALGASQRRIVHTVIGRESVAIVTGIAVGALVALLASRWLASFVFGVSTTDPTTFVGATTVLAIVGLLASYLPARRAGALQPVEVFREAKGRGLMTGYVSNGHGTPEVIEYIRPWVDLYKIDLKCHDEKKYRRLGGNFQEVLATIRLVHEVGLWVEIVTLVIPDYNDSEKELGHIAEFIASVSLDIPWHVTAFHPDYKMADRGPTPGDTLLRAHQLGRKAGLNYVYCGNLHGRMGGLENTFCPKCGGTLIERTGFRVLSNRLTNGGCPNCAAPIPGRWQGSCA